MSQETARKIGAVQWDLRLGDVRENLIWMERLAREAAATGVKLLVLPELWPVSFDTKREAAIADSERALEHVRALSAELGLILIGSSLERAHGKLYNGATIFEAGRLLASYRKTHLFSPTGEPAAFARGEADPPVVETSIGRVGVVICYDIRFPETVRKAYAQEVDILAVPAQWATPRLDHWRALLVARAIENQCYVVGANRCGSEDQGGRANHFPGHSLVLDPWGEVLAEGAGSSGWICGEFSRKRLAEVCRLVPARRDARLPEK